MTEPDLKSSLTGATLSGRRSELRMGLAEVAAQLLLSEKQVQALEAEDTSAFYNEAFYRQARRRYAALLGFAEAPTHPAPSTVAASEPIVVAPPPEPEAVAPRSWLMPSLLALAALIGGAYFLLRGDAVITGLATLSTQDARQAEPAPTPATSQEPANAPAPTATTEPPASALVAAPPAATQDPPVAAPVAPEPSTPQPANQSLNGTEVARLEFEASGLCWVFARDLSGKETKVTLKAGQRLSLTAALAYLAVGDISAVRLRVNEVEKSLERFSNNGRVARLGQQELAALRSGSENPTPAD